MTTHALPYSLAQLVQGSATTRSPAWARAALAVLRLASQNARTLLAAVDYLRIVDVLARKDADAVVRFEGLIERIGHSDHAAPIDADDALHRDLRDFEAEKRDYVATLRAFFPDETATSAKVLRAIEAARAVVAASEDLRAAVQAHDANVDALRRARSGGPIRGLTSAADVDADLGEFWR